tara:strand:- start:519 stop:905 length:387 start_codon:yes stop_codon:yes gene_type:complete
MTVMRDMMRGLGEIPQGRTMMARGDDDEKEIKVPTDIIDDPSGMLETDIMELRQMLDSEGLLRTSFNDAELEYLKGVYDRLEDMNQLEDKYQGEDGFKLFTIQMGESLLATVRERMPSKDQGIASLRA